jgi:nitrite reductase/ring-hydroxylating ferredoxin subunit
MYKVCGLSELADPGSRGATIELRGRVVELLVVCKAAKVYAYRNRCPHTGITLEWQPDQFLDLSQSYIQCVTHGALFRIEDGICVRGPCTGDALTPLPVFVEEGQVLVEVDEPGL